MTDNLKTQHVLLFGGAGIAHFRKARKRKKTFFVELFLRIIDQNYNINVIFPSQILENRFLFIITKQFQSFLNIKKLTNK